MVTLNLGIRLNNAGKWGCNRLTEDADFGKKKTYFQMKLILILAGMWTSKIVAFGVPKTRTFGVDFGSEA